MMRFLLRLFSGSKEARSKADEDFAQNVQLICSMEFFVPCLQSKGQSKKKQSKKAEKSVPVEEKAPVQKPVDTAEKPLKRLFPWLF